MDMAARELGTTREHHERHGSRIRDIPDPMSRSSSIALLATIAASCGPAAAPAAPARARIVEVDGARDVSFEDLVDALLEARAIYVGEQHDREADHRVQLSILEAIATRDPSVALGLEMVQHPRQAELDAFVEGTIDEAALLERLDWRRSWGFDFALYRPLFEHARAHRMPIVALNAPRELTRAIAQGGLGSLDEAQRASLPELDLSNAEHRAMVEESLAGHPGMTPERLDHFYAAQVLWDETMADTAARFLAADGAPARIVVIAGARHVQSGLGIPQRAARRGLSPFVIVMPVRASELDEALAADPPLADYLFVTPD